MSEGLDNWIKELKLSGYNVRAVEHYHDELNDSYLIEVGDGTGVTVLQANVLFDWPWSAVVFGRGGEDVSREFDTFDDVADWVNEMLRCEST
jgi:hypothetical protein